MPGPARALNACRLEFREAIRTPKPGTGLSAHRPNFRINPHLFLVRDGFHPSVWRDFSVLILELKPAKFESFGWMVAPASGLLRIGRQIQNKQHKEPGNSGRTTLVFSFHVLESIDQTFVTYCNDTSTSTMPLPSLSALMALPTMAPCARVWSVAFITWPGVLELVSRSPGLMEPLVASARA